MPDRRRGSLAVAPKGVGGPRSKSACGTPTGAREHTGIRPPFEKDGGALLTGAMRLSTVAATRSNRGVWQSALHARWEL